MRRASCATSAQLVRVIDPSPQAVTISRVAMLALGMVDEPHHAQRKVLHRPKFHGHPLRAPLRARRDLPFTRTRIKRRLSA